ncbi:MAG: hypothetical protein ABUS79_07360 [Pseudomonadota bacterium]
MGTSAEAGATIVTHAAVVVSDAGALHGYFPERIGLGISQQRAHRLIEGQAIGLHAMRVVGEKPLP